MKWFECLSRQGFTLSLGVSHYQNLLFQILIWEFTLTQEDVKNKLWYLKKQNNKGGSVEVVDLQASVFTSGGSWQLRLGFIPSFKSYVFFLTGEQSRLCFFVVIKMQLQFYLDDTLNLEEERGCVFMEGMIIPERAGNSNLSIASSSTWPFTR